MDILYFKLGDVMHFDVVLRQARRVCGPDTTLYVLGDKPMNDSVFVDVAQYQPIIDDFLKCYQHKSTNSYDFQSRALARWLVMAKAIEDLGLEEVFVSDWDVMLMSDIGDTAERFRQAGCDFTLSKGEAGGTSFWFNLWPLRRHVERMWDVYRNPDGEEAQAIFGHYDNLQRQGLPGGVCDMTFLKRLHDKGGYMVGDTSKPLNARVCDHNWLMPDGYQMQDGNRKRIVWRDGYAHFAPTDCNVLVRCDWVHCSAHTRIYVPQLFNEFTEHGRK